jgi:hypothetical protein
MNLAAVEKIARAVLYEGYMLYPYRPSSVKNRQRFNFGVLYPQSYAELQAGADAFASQTQCLVYGSVLPEIEIRFRFLRSVQRFAGRLAEPLPQWPPGEDQVCFEPVDCLEIDDRRFYSGREVEEQELGLRLVYGDSVSCTPLRYEHDFPGRRKLEPLPGSAGEIRGVIARECESLTLVVEIRAERCREDVFKFSARISNQTPFADPSGRTRDDALMCSLISTHAVLGANNCEFVSLLDPPEELSKFAAGCQNIGTWPVLVGEPGRRDTMLSSPIILYDYPQVAPESIGDLFEGTEIDEILSLRIMTLTAEEKREVRETDARARRILERTESMPPEQFMKLHGVVRSMRPLNDNDKEVS